MTHPPSKFDLQARKAVESGNPEYALQILEDGIRCHPSSSQLRNTAGSISLQIGKAGDAAEFFRLAFKLSPDNFEIGLNCVIALSAKGDHEIALNLARDLERKGKLDPRYWSARAHAARQSGDLKEAAQSYDRCLALNPEYKRGQHGRARTALERGENDAVLRFDQAIQSNPQVADLWLGKAQALDAAGQPAEALALAEQISIQLPNWVEALTMVAQLKLSLGIAAFDQQFREAAERQPNDKAIVHAHIQVLASQELYGKAARVAKRAQATFEGDPWFELAEAINVGMSGDHERAKHIFDNLELDSPQRWLHQGRHHLRAGELTQAEKMLQLSMNESELTHTAYALLGILWRVREDPRAVWLHEQPGIIQSRGLKGGTALFQELTSVLNYLHDKSSFPLGQSLRGGTQTRHILLNRHEAVFEELRNCILNTLEEYRLRLPPQDEKHPFLKFRDSDWKLAGSWSVRLRAGGDHHAPHIHPQGMLSSALYLVVPSENSDGSESGFLELGRPPADLGLDLPPLLTIKPAPLELALFPSTLFHGTRPFTGTNRMTVAFDVIPVPKATNDRK